MKTEASGFSFALYYINSGVKDAFYM
jgi:hypothetical protein